MNYPFRIETTPLTKNQLRVGGYGLVFTIVGANRWPRQHSLSFQVTTPRGCRPLSRAGVAYLLVSQAWYDSRFLGDQ